MMPHDCALEDPFRRDRLVVVAEPGGGLAPAGDLRRHFPDCSVVSCDSYLQGIAELLRRPARAVIACVASSSSGQLDRAVAGLREAAGGKTKLLLCCRPEAEPIARSAVAHGADDYVLYPIDGAELDRAMCDQSWSPSSELTPPLVAPGEELHLLADVLSELSGHPQSVLDRLARLLHAAIRCEGVTVAVEGASASAGDPVEVPVLTVPIRDDQTQIGRIVLGPPIGAAYGPDDTEKLAHYARIAGYCLSAASGHRLWRKLAVTDELSGLPNRRCLLDSLDRILAQAANHRFPVTLLIFDVDNLKTYNDKFGHRAGDEVIRVTASLFRAHCREQDVVARYGGDEFAVVFWDPKGPRLAGSNHPASALAVLERFTAALRTQKFPALGSSGTGTLTISGGLATYPWDAGTRDDLIQRADEALLAAKRAGKNRIYLVGHHETTDQT